MIIVAGYAALKHTNGWNDNKPKTRPAPNCTGGLIPIVAIIVVTIILLTTIRELLTLRLEAFVTSVVYTVAHPLHQPRCASQYGCFDMM